MIPARCYMHYAFDPYRNMAVDEYLFARATESPGAVFLRLYSWEPGAITFGFNQKIEKAVRHELLGGTPLIRRVTGGRALYHDPSELTYAVVVNAEGLDAVDGSSLSDGESGVGAFSESIARSSAAIAEALTAFLAEIGLESQYLRHTVQADRRPEYFHTAPCFNSVARHEIISGEKKVVASAQRRVGTTLLQHGSIKVSGVAYHAALDGRACPAGRETGLEAVRGQHFRNYAGVFFDVMGRWLGLSCEVTELDAGEAAGVEKRCVEVKNNSGGRRDIIKQEVVGGSL